MRISSSLQTGTGRGDGHYELRVRPGTGSYAMEGKTVPVEFKSLRVTGYELVENSLKAEFGATVFKSFKFRSRSILSPSPSRRACINSSRKSLLPLLAVPHAEKRVEIQLEIAH